MTLPVVSSDTLWGIGLALLAVITYGSCMVAVSFLLRGLGSGPGSMVAAAASVLAGLVVAAVQFGVGTVATPSMDAVLLFALAGVMSTYLGRWLVFESINRLGPSRAAALQCISPLFTAVLGALLLGELLGPLGLLGIGLGIAGLTTMSLGGQPQQRSPGTTAAAGRQGDAMLVSLLVGIASSLAYSGSYVARAAAVREWNEPLLGVGLGGVAGLAALMVASRKQLGGYFREIQSHRSAAAVYFAVGTLQFLAQGLVIASMRYIPASLASLVSMATPLVVLPLSFLVLRKQENLTPAVVAGIMITLAGIALVVLYGARI